MSKYFQVAKITFQEYFVYRLNFVLWRFRSLVFLLTLLFFWLAIYGDHQNLFGYQKAQMLTYVIGVAFLRSLVLASRSADLAGQIKSGELTKFLVQPFKIIYYWLAKDAVDKGLNLFFAILEIAAVLWLLQLPFWFPHNFFTYIAFFILVFLSMLLYFFLSFILSITAFWIEEVWATRWLFGIIFLEFFAGAFFPLDVLPKWLTQIIYLTPFPYLVFLPLKIWLEQLSTASIFKAIIICFGWLVVSFCLANFLWKKGAKNYGAYGG